MNSTKKIWAKMGKKKNNPRKPNNNNLRKRRSIQNIHSTKPSDTNTEWFARHRRNKENWCTLPLSRKSNWIQGKNRCNKGSIPKRRTNKNKQEVQHT